MNINKIITNVTVRQQSSLYVKNRVSAREKKPKVLEGPLGIRKNLFIVAHSAYDMSRNNQK